MNAITIGDDLHLRILGAMQAMENLRLEAKTTTCSPERMERIRAEHSDLCDLVLRLEQEWRESPEAGGAS